MDDPNEQPVEGNMQDFLASFTADAPIPDNQMPTEGYVRLISSAGGARDVPIDATHTTDGLPGYRLSEIFAMSELTFGANLQYYMGETLVTPETVIAAGSAVTIIGVVKGG